MKTTTSKNQQWFRGLSAWLIIIIAAPLLACQIPVFRYALERWQADQYQVFVLHDGSLDAAATAQVKSLQGSNSETPIAANFVVNSLTANEIKDPDLRQIWEHHSDPAKPMMVVRYPKASKDVSEQIVSVTELSEKNVAIVINSPVRQELSKKMMAGESAVWLFVPCGDSKKDATALTTLTEQTERDESQLELPVQDEIESEEDLVQASHLELRIQFSVLTVNRDDPREQFLLNSLLRSEADLLELNEPMAFPVIGRGRVLYALVGKGISEKTIAAASRFMVGPCSCQVKNQNPGFDLLLARAWDTELFGGKLPVADEQKTSRPVQLKIPAGRSGK